MLVILAILAALIIFGAVTVSKWLLFLLVVLLLIAVFGN